MLQAIAQDSDSSDDAIAAFMGVNPYMVTGYRGWFRKTGLGTGTSGKYMLSSLGRLISNHDPDLQQPDTLWLLHYYLCSEHEERAEVWYRCFNEFLTPGKSFSTAELQMHIEQRLDETPSNKEGVKKDTATLINCYTQSETLGDLRLLVKRTKASISVGDITAPDPLIVGFVLLDSWPRRFGTTDSVRLSMLVDEPESIGRVFVASNQQVRTYIGQIERLGLVTFADTQFEPVTRRFVDDPLTLVKRYFQKR